MLATIKNRRELEANRLNVTPDVAELLFTTDDKKLYVGDGTTAGGILISDNAFITEDMTLNVPAEYADINEALDFLSAFRIKDNAIVTIQVADGTYTYTEEIVINHPDSANLKIIGNETNPTACTIWNPVSNNVISINKRELGYISGFKILGHNDEVNYPLNGQTVYRRGLMVSNNSGVVAGKLEAHNCFRGIEVSNISQLTINSYTASYNSESGLLTDMGSLSQISGSCSITSNSIGLFANGNSVIIANKSSMITQSNTTYGVYCINQSEVFIDHATATGNTTKDLYAANSGFIEAVGTTYSTLSPAINTQGNHLGYIRN
ncbi:MAG: hypothetical protein C0603_05570 [Denitrovibrio sp.]|nr:MAG: hypothetical protein C0603_05570 [Denitrovibrio sp.]